MRRAELAEAKKRAKTYKERKKHDRFDGMPEEEVSKRVLPDHLANNLDIIIVSWLEEKRKERKGKERWRRRGAIEDDDPVSRGVASRRVASRLLRVESFFAKGEGLIGLVVGITGVWLAGKCIWKVARR